VNCLEAVLNYPIRRAPRSNGSISTPSGAWFWRRGKGPGRAAADRPGARNQPKIGP